MLWRVFLFLFFLNTSCWANDTNGLFNFANRQDEALVVKVVASDLIVLEDGRRIKLIGIQSAGPIPRKPVKYDSKGRIIEDVLEEPTISIQEQALTYAQELMENKKVKLEYDDDEGDAANGHTLAYVYLPDGRMANAELLRMGFVTLKIIPPNVKYEEKLEEAYQEAKKEKRGLEGD